MLAVGFSKYTPVANTAMSAATAGTITVAR